MELGVPFWFFFLFFVLIFFLSHLQDVTNSNLKDNQELQIHYILITFSLTDHPIYCLLGGITKNPKTFLVTLGILKCFFAQVLCGI